MKLAVVSSTVFAVPLQGYGGLESIAWLQAKGLAEMGHQVVLIAPDGSECPGVQVVHTGPAGRHTERMAYGGWEGMNPDGSKRKWEGYWKMLPSFDVVLDHSWSKWAINLKAEGVLKCPVLLWLHAPVQTMFQQAPPVDKPCFVAISEDQARTCMSHLNRKAQVCYNGVDTDYYQPLNIPRSDRYLFLARFSTIKGPDLAIEACKKAGVGLDLIGDTSITNEPELLAKCKKMCDGKQIRMVGSASRGNCVWWYSQAKAMLHLNQRFQEPFGLAPIEAQLCGCPVIAWDNGAMRETIQGEDHPRSGFLVDNLESVVQLLKDNAVESIDRDECRNWASKFSVERMVRRVHDLCVLATGNGDW